MEITDDRFVLTGWQGIAGNQRLYKDKIKGYALEFAKLTPDDSSFVAGTILIDSMTVFSKRDRQDIIFNGVAVPSNRSLRADLA